jgi:hypothetical protein
VVPTAFAVFFNFFVMFMVRDSLVHVYALFGYLELLLGALICSLLLKGQATLLLALEPTFLAWLPY